MKMPSYRFIMIHLWMNKQSFCKQCLTLSPKDKWIFRSYYILYYIVVLRQCETTVSVPFSNSNSHAPFWNSRCWCVNNISTKKHAYDDFHWILYQNTFKFPKVPRWTSKLNFGVKKTFNNISSPSPYCLI